MDIFMRNLLTDNLFHQADILAGKNGLDRMCRRVSVFDCPFHRELMDMNIIEDGDLFLSCLEQFHTDPDSLQDFAQALVRHHSAGLLLPPSAALDVLNEEILTYFDHNDFPVILLKTSISYGHIMSVVNDHLHYADQSVINGQKLNRLLHDSLGDAEKEKILLGLNPHFRKYVRTLFVTGTFYTDRLSSLLLSDYAQYMQDSLLMGDYTVFILSENDEKTLRNHTNATSSQLGGYFKDYHIGFSRIHALENILDAFREGELAVKVSCALNNPQQSYDPLLTQQLIFTLQNAAESRDFYNTYVETIAAGISADMLPEWLKTIELFVARKGDYTAVAEELHQHVNTIRYRINRVKKLLNLENDTVRFYETISIATKLKICYDTMSI